MWIVCGQSKQKLEAEIKNALKAQSGAARNTLLCNVRLR
jgi:hypothetical protein